MSTSSPTSSWSSEDSSLHRTGRVALDDEVEFLHQTGLERLVQVLQGEPDSTPGEVGVALARRPLLGDLTRRTVLVDDQEVVACARDVGETQDQDGSRRSRFLDVVAVVVEHRPDAAVSVADHHRVADAQRAALDQDRRDGTAATVEVGLDRNTLRVLLRVGPQVERGVRGEDHGLQESLDVEALLGGDVDEHRVAAVLLGHQTELGQLTTDLGRVRALDVDLVDRDHDRHVGRLGVVQRLDRLGHHTVVGRHHEDRDVGRLGTTGTHGGERLVTRGVDEGDLALFVVDLSRDLVRTDVLRDTAGLTRDDVRLADGVEEAGLTVVDVTHDGHDRRTRDEELLAALVLTELDVEGLEQLAVLLLGADDLEDEVHLVREELQRLVGDGLRGSDHLAEVHHHADERRRVGADLLGEVGEGRTTRQADGLSVAARQHHAADRRGLHGLVLLAPLPLRLATTTRGTAGTTEGALRATTATRTTGTATEAGTTAATATGTTGTAGETAATATTGTGRTTGEAATAATGTTGEPAATATGTTAAATAGTTRTTATATGTAATGATAGTRGARSGTLRHHAGVGTIAAGTATGTRSATGTTLRTRHAARTRTPAARTLRTGSATLAAARTLRTRSTGTGSATGTTLAAGTRSALRTGRLGTRHAGGATGREGVVARTRTGRTGTAGTRSALATRTRGARTLTAALATVLTAVLARSPVLTGTRGTGTGTRGAGTGTGGGTRRLCGGRRDRCRRRSGELRRGGCRGGRLRRGLGARRRT